MAANWECCRNIDEYGLVGSSGAPVAPSGELIVAGYVVTKHFSVFMDSIDAVGKIKLISMVGNRELGKVISVYPQPALHKL